MMSLEHLLAFAWGLAILAWLAAVVMNTIQNPDL